MVPVSEVLVSDTIYTVKFMYQYINLIVLRHINIVTIIYSVQAYVHFLSAFKPAVSEVLI